MRVLLADESSTIKKAIQMVLSDYGVEVKMVPTGIDVLSVAKDFKPDIVLADVLLSKKNGYEVTAELKNDPETKNVPVVLMWSSFIQLDDEQYKTCQASASLEKPFDTDTIRKLVEQLVPKLQTFPLKGFLNHPMMPDFEESDTFVRQKNEYNTAIIQKAAAMAENEKTPTNTGFAINVDGSNTAPQEPAQQHASTPAPAAPTTPSQASTDADVFSKVDLRSELPPQPQDEWTTNKGNQFLIETENLGEFEEVKVINSQEEKAPALQQKLSEEFQKYIKDSTVATHRAQTALQQKNVHSSFDEQLMREEIRQITERICWQVIPEIAEKIIRDELNKLLEGIERQP